MHVVTVQQLISQAWQSDSMVFLTKVF